MPARRKLTARQLKLLIEFAENHRDIAMGRTSGGPLAVQATRQAWHTIALQLNAVADGVKKTPYQWRRYWIELKAKTKTKAADSRRHIVRDSNGPNNKLVPLNEVEKRVLALVDPVAVKKLLNVWIPIVAKAEVPSPEPSVEDELLGESPAAEVHISKVERPPSVDSQPENEDTGEEEELVPEPMVSTRENNLPQPNFLVYSGPPPQPPVYRLKKQKQVRIDDSVPRWAYNLERRRIAAEERHATALEALVDILSDIRDNMRRIEPQ